MTRIACSALALTLLTSSAGAVAQAYDLGKDGMHSLSFKQNTPVAAPTANIDTQKAQPSYDEKRQAIWDKYKAIATGEADKPASGHPLTTQSPDKAMPYSAQAVIENYQKAQQERQDMQSLHFDAPKTQ